jgi:DNA gyrase/topoisomerase IV subunit B
MDRKPYTAADLTVLSLEEAVRKRAGMYFPAEPGSLGLLTGILQGVIGDALHADDGGHRPVDVEITAGLRFTVTDNQPLDLDDPGAPKPGFYGSLISMNRRVLAAAAALSTHTLIEVRAGGRGWRQELTGTTPGRPEPFTTSGQADGTRITFDLDPAFLAPDAAISTSPEHLRARRPGCEACASAQRDESLTIRDRRT